MEIILASVESSLQGSYGAWKSLNSMEFHLLKIKALKAWNFINQHGKPGIRTLQVHLTHSKDRPAIKQKLPVINHTIFQCKHPGTFLWQLHSLVPRNFVIGRYYEIFRDDAVLTICHSFYAILTICHSFCSLLVMYWLVVAHAIRITPTKQTLQISTIYYQCSRWRLFWAIIRGFSRTDAIFQIFLRPVEAVFVAVQIGL